LIEDLLYRVRVMELDETTRPAGDRLDRPVAHQAEP
jgi:hypothetical protein